MDKGGRKERIERREGVLVFGCCCRCCCCCKGTHHYRYHDHCRHGQGWIGTESIFIDLNKPLTGYGLA